jgi:hypothetical protein
MISKIPRFNCTITQQNIEIHNKDYLNLKDIADELKLSYAIVANISCGRKPNKCSNNFIYFPDIKITKLELDYNLIYKEQKEIKENKIKENKN